MRLNPKVYQLAEGYEPVETQEFDGRIVQVYYLDDFDAIYNQNVPKGKFVVWTSANGTDYRLFIEKGFYHEVHELYTQPINKIWLDFWDQCDDVTKKYNFRILIPLAIVCLAIYIILNFIPGIESWSIYAQLAIFIVFIGGMLVLNKLTKNKIAEYNKASVNLIKEELTPEGFDAIIEKQKEYIDRFFDEKQKEIDAELAAEEEKEKAEATEENKVAYVDEEPSDSASDEVKSALDEPKDIVEEPDNLMHEPKDVIEKTDSLLDDVVENKNNKQE